jgi:hypothetical protein
MKNKVILSTIAILGSFICWAIIDMLIVELPIWKYLIIETLIIITKMLYEKEKKRLTGI